jgi:hypothetical protein
MKVATLRPLADPEHAARKIIETAKTIELVQDGASTSALPEDFLR